MYFENLSDRTDADNLGRMLAGLLATDLGGTEHLEVVSSQRLSDIAQQLGKPDGTPDRMVATDVARRAGAAKMVLGQVARVGSRMVATAELVEVAGGRRLGSYQAEGSSPHDIFSMAEALGVHLRADLTGRPRQPGAHGSLIRQLTNSADAYRAYVRGEAFLHRLELEKAAEEFRQAVRIDPEFALAHYRLSLAASSYGEQGPRLLEARAAAERAAALKDKLPPRDRDLMEGNLLFVTGRLTEAVPLLEAALARNPEHKELLFLLSECYTHSPRDYDPRRAAELAERVLALDPDFHSLYTHVALNYAFVGDFAKVSERLDVWEPREPETVRLLRSQMRAFEGRTDEALRLSESTKGPSAVSWRIRYAVAASRWDIAKSLLTEEERLGKLHRRSRAHLDATLGAFDRAENGYRETLTLQLEADENVGGALVVLSLHALAELKALKADHIGAQREAERALTVQPDGPFCLYYAGRFAILAGDLPAAERHLRRLEEVTKIARGPLVPRYRDVLMAELALARGRPLEAQYLLEHVVGSGRPPSDAWLFEPGPAFREAMTRTYLAIGERRKAAEVLEVQVNSGLERVAHPVLYVRALYTLGALRFDLGDRVRGRALLQKFLEHWARPTGIFPKCATLGLAWRL